MTAQQFRLCLELLRWPQWRIAEDLGVPPLKVRKWSCGAEEIPDVVAVWLRAISKQIDDVYARFPPPAVPRKPYCMQVHAGSATPTRLSKGRAAL